MNSCLSPFSRPFIRTGHFPSIFPPRCSAEVDARNANNSIAKSIQNLAAQFSLTNVASLLQYSRELKGEEEEEEMEEVGGNRSAEKEGIGRWKVNRRLISIWER